MEMTAVNSATDLEKLLYGGKKSFSCNQCDYKSKESAKLKIHMRVHSGEKPFDCTQCDYSAKQKVHLKMNLLKHSGQKPFSYV